MPDDNAEGLVKTAAHKSKQTPPINTPWFSSLSNNVVSALLVAAILALFGMYTQLAVLTYKVESQELTIDKYNTRLEKLEKQCILKVKEESK